MAIVNTILSRSARLEGNTTGGYGYGGPTIGGRTM